MINPNIWKVVWDLVFVPFLAFPAPRRRYKAKRSPRQVFTQRSWRPPKAQLYKFFLKFHLDLHSYCQWNSITSGSCVGQRGGDDKTINAQHSQRAFALVRVLSPSPSSSPSPSIQGILIIIIITITITITITIDIILIIAIIIAIIIVIVIVIILIMPLMTFLAGLVPVREPPVDLSRPSRPTRTNLYLSSS